MLDASPVISPCVKICQLNAEQICTGCGRTLEEIAYWLQTNEPGRQAILELSQRRLAEFRSQRNPRGHS